MSITPIGLTKTAGFAATAAGVLFIGIQIGHPQLNATSIATTNVFVRDQLKVLMCVLALVGISGMYLSQLRRNGVLGLVGYGVLALAYLGIMCTTFVAAYILPEVTSAQSRYVNDIIAIDTHRGTVVGAIGALNTVIQVEGFAYLVGGLIFGIALFRAKVLARWACVLLAVGGIATAVLSLMPDAFYRLLAFPNGIAMIGLGISLWRSTQTGAALDPAATTIPTSRMPSSSEQGVATTAGASPIHSDGR